MPVPSTLSGIRHAIEVAVGRPRVQHLFEHNDGALIHKCPHYFDIYERHFRRYQRTAPTVLEIGVFHGGSLRMWNRYFGSGSTIVGVDIDPRAATVAAPPSIHVRVGDQSDGEFLRRVVEEFGPFDIVIDDGSHIPRHQIASLEHLWDAVAPDGVYFVEDLCTNYWPDYEGGPGRETFMDFARSMVDDINAFNSRSDELRPSSWTREVTGMHVYDSVVVLDRGRHEPLETVMSGRPTFTDDAGNPYDVQLTDEHRAALAAHDERTRRRAAVAQRVPEPVVRAVSAARRRLRRDP